MPLPEIAGYPLPGRGGLPENRVPWELDPERAVLLVHDMQRYFTAAFPASGAPLEQLIPNIAQLVAACSVAEVPVVFSRQRVQPPAERGLLSDFWGSGLAAGTGGEELVPEVSPASAWAVVDKRRYSAFHDTGLAELMERWGRDQLVVCGIYAHIGCLVTAVDAFMRDLQPFFVADAVADFGPKDHREAVRYAASTCARVCLVQDVVTAVKQG
jgi:bifunctional isochorismate lyase/aryl carrier protein